MIVKEADPKGEAVAQLEKLVAAATGDRRKHLERELRIMQAGIKGERESAYHIDFYYGPSKNYAVLHDLRLEVNGRVAQIDHLLVGRMMQCFVLETKHFASGVKITEDGEFLRWNDYKKTFEGMASPVAQNERHIAVLRDAFATIELPQRLGFRLAPTFRGLVLVSPDARVDRPARRDTSDVIKADVLASTLDRLNDEASPRAVVGGLAKLVSLETVEQVARRLAALHRPLPVDVLARFGGEAPARTPTGPLAATPSPVEPASPVQTPPTVVVAPPAAVVTVTSSDVPRCRTCLGQKLSILYGSSYYFKCADCDANTPARVSCGQPGHRERLRKQGARFFRECEGCGTSTLYFTNPPT